MFVSDGHIEQEPSKQYLGDAQPFSLKQLSADKPKFTDASHLFRHPHRASRPDHFVIILRGLPGVLCVNVLLIVYYLLIRLLLIEKIS